MSDQSDAIVAVRTEHIRAVNSTDVERLLDGMTDDVVYLAPDLPPIRGKAAVREFVRPIYEKATISIAMHAESLDVSGDRAVEWGIVRGSLRMGAEPSVAIRLNYLFAYRREADGHWRISHDISNQAAPEAAEQGG